MMDIKPEFFSPIISTWQMEESFSEATIEKIIDILGDIFKTVCNDIFEDEKINLEELALFARHVINRALQVQLSKFTNSKGRRLISSTYSKKLKKPNDLELLPFTELCIREQKLDINTATAEEFEDLPGIGGETAKRLIDYRTSFKKFSDIEEIKNVRGVSNKDFKILKEIITVAELEIVYEPKSELLERFNNDPTFPSYIALLREGISFTHRYDENTPLDFKIINELITFKNKLHLNSIPLEIKLPIIRASDIKETLHYFSLIEALEEQHSSPKPLGRILFDHQYQPFVDQLLKEAKIRIYINMFFFRFLDEPSYVTDSLVGSLISFAEQGGEVKVLIEGGDVNDNPDTSDANSELYRFLSKTKAEVRYDTDEKATHSKLVLVDTEHIVIGSHNWTAGSFYQYDDTSAYIKSPELAKYYENLFKKRWENGRTTTQIVGDD